MAKKKTTKKAAKKKATRKKVIEGTGKKKTGRGSGLTPWKKGQSGNPKGRPAGRFVSAHLKELSDQNAATVPHVSAFIRDEWNLDPKEFTVGEFMAYMMVYKAFESNDPKRVEQVLDRLEGKALQQIKQDIDARVKGYGKVSPDDWDEE